VSGVQPDRAPGVYRLGADGRPGAPVHAYRDDGYELAEVAELLGIGTPSHGGAALTLSGHELRLLRIAADAQSFDHAPEFIAMCLDIAALELGPGEEKVTLISVG